MDADRCTDDEWGLPPLPAVRRGRARAGWLRAWLWCEGAWRDFLNLVLPAECVACGREDHALCPACSSLLRRQTRTPFRAEGSADALMGVLGESHLPVVAGGEYRDTLAAAILAFKNHGRTELSAPLCRCLARTLAFAIEQLPAAKIVPSQDPGDPPGPAPADSPMLPLWLVPIPSSGTGWRRRGYDPVAMILRSMTGEGRLPPGVVIAPILGIKPRLPWHRHHQKGLGRAARRRNVRNTMRIKRTGCRGFWLSVNVAGGSMVLVDDVLTTGSTLREGAKTLETAGLRVCSAVVLAAARAPDPGRKNPAAEGLAKNTFSQKMNKPRQ